MSLGLESRAYVLNCFLKHRIHNLLALTKKKKNKNTIIQGKS